MYFVPLDSVPNIIANIIEVLILLIIIEAIIANIIAFGGRISPYNPFVKFVRRIVNPVLEPVRRLIPPYKTGGWDLSPLVVIVLLQVIRGLLF